MGLPGGFGMGNGGGIVNVYGNLFVRDSTLTENQAVGGNYNTASGNRSFSGAGLGGAIANYMGATSDVVDSELHHNRPAGGEGNSASGGPVPASLSAGGAINNALGSYVIDTGFVFAPSIVNVTNSRLERNKALGGEGEDGTIAGDGWGGARAAQFSAITNVTGSIHSKIHAIGGEADDDCYGGYGYGGGA